MNVVAVCSAFLAFLALIFLAIAMATNYWYIFDKRIASNPSAALNPLRENTKLPGTTITYDVDHFGLWLGCHKERTFGGKLSCAYIGSKCYSNVCWIRNMNKADTTCLNSRVAPIRLCAAYQVTRAFTIIGALALILGVSMLIVSNCLASKPLSASGGLITGIAALALMVAFAVFFSNVFKSGPLDPLGNIGWSFVLFLIAWPLCFISCVMGMLARAREGADGAYYYESEGREDS
jgi:peptidoglycan/LPS O-acetylase OafA/YrhL